MFLGLVGSLDSASSAMPNPIVIEVTADAQQGCIFKFEGQAISDTAFAKLLKAESDKKRQVRVLMSGSAPWRCVAGAIYVAQKSGFENVGFISNPDPP